MIAQEVSILNLPRDWLFLISSVEPLLGVVYSS